MIGGGGVAVRAARAVFFCGEWPFLGHFWNTYLFKL